MTFQQNIYATIRNAKFFSGTLLTEIGLRQTYGEDLVVIKNRFIILGKWIEILQDYYDNNFDANGIIDPIETCLTQVEIEELMSKTKVMIGNNRYTLESWILSYAVWYDQNRWEDSEQWQDFPPLN